MSTLFKKFRLKYSQDFDFIHNVMFLCLLVALALFHLSVTGEKQHGKSQTM